MTSQERIQQLEKEKALLYIKLETALKAIKSPRDLFQELALAGQIDPKPINDKYVIDRTNLVQFIEWIFDNNYDEDISPELIFHRFRTIKTEQFALHTIKKYFQRIKE